MGIFTCRHNRTWYVCEECNYWTLSRNKCSNCDSWYTLEEGRDMDDTYCWKESCYAADIESR